MPFAIPSLGDLVERSRRAFRSYLPGSDAWLWPNNLNPTAKVIAGMTHEVFGFADYVARQKFAITADSEHLDLHGEEFGLARRPTSPARGRVRISSQTACSVTAGAMFRRGDGIEYRALNAAQSVSGPTIFDVDVIAASEGSETSALANTPLEVVSGVTGLALAEVAPGGIVGGADIEDDEAFRERILFRKRYPPHGGAASDYVMWSQQVPGVTRVFVDRLWHGAGTVCVYVLMDDLYLNGLAPAAEVLRVRDHIETVRPAGAIVTVTAPQAQSIDIVIGGLFPDTTQMRELVAAELRGAFQRLSRVAGADESHGGMPFLASPTSFSRSWIWQTVANAAGEERHRIIAPSDDIVIDAGKIAVLGTVSFVQDE